MKFVHISRENAIYTALWLILIIMPVAGEYFQASADSAATFDWGRIATMWKVIAFYLGVFLIHNLVLAPLLIYKRRRLAYIALTLGLIAVFALCQCYSHPMSMQPAPGRMERPMGGPRDGKTPPPPPRGHAMPELSGSRHPKPMPKPSGERHEDMPVGPMPIVNVLILVGLLGLNLGVKLYFKAESDRKHLRQVEQEKVYQQLRYLEYQINPHFFMNTLNNIQVLIDIDPERAKASLRQLSVMMRFVLYEADKDRVPLSKETSFLRNYIRLMRLRYTDNLSVTMDIPDNMPEAMVPPMVFVTFIENSFKHGVSYHKESYINITMDVEDGRLLFYCVNSKKDEAERQTGMPREGGIGLKNVRRRLSLIYGDNYSLDIDDGDRAYSVRLSIPLETAGQEAKRPIA